MYVQELIFDCYQDVTLERAEKSLMAFLDSLRCNGQVIGREFPTTIDNGALVTRVIVPTEDAVHPDRYSAVTRHRLEQLNQSGLLKPKIRHLGRELFSDTADECAPPPWQILFTTYLHECSPLRCGDHFLPIPLFQVPPVGNGDHKALLKWQEDWQACDQLQMNGATSETASLLQMGELNSDLSRRGRDLCKRIEYLTKVPTYYYLYRVGGDSEQQEKNRRCPSCDHPWALEQPIHDVFHFKCDNCRLVSNLSWDFQ